MPQTVGEPASILRHITIAPGTISNGRGTNRLTTSAEACEQDEAFLATPFSPKKV